jgi:predicted adenylyl cyclase CyaB
MPDQTLDRPEKPVRARNLAAKSADRALGQEKRVRARKPPPETVDRALQQHPTTAPGARTRIGSMSGPPRRNIELKARDAAPERSLACCRELGAVDRGTLWQRDTYFPVRSGRLKLREQRPGDAVLIQYERADAPDQRESRYRLVRVLDVEDARQALTDALGVTVTVVKQRRLFLWKNVRIHLDDVEGLGRFIELEAVAAPASDLDTEWELIALLRERLSIADEHLVASGYAQQMLAL